jgi:WD40 repeat protein
MEESKLKAVDCKEIDDKYWLQAHKYNQKLSIMRMACKNHESDIGGICDNFDCYKKFQLFCIKCVMEKDSCMNIKNHNLISIKETFDKFENEFITLKKDFNYSKSISKVQYYLDNSDHVCSEFEKKMKDLKNHINNYFLEFLEKIKKIQEEFNKEFENLFVEKFHKLNQTLIQLNDFLNYEYLCRLDTNSLKSKVLKMPNENINTTITFMKKFIHNLKNNSHIDYCNTIDRIVNINNEEVNHNYQNNFQLFQTYLVEKYDYLKKTMTPTLFNYDSLGIYKKINKFTLNQEFNIDWSSNSIFKDKIFSIFENSQGKVIFAYPTSQYTIKLENFEKFFDEEATIITSNKTINNEVNLNYRDKYLLTRLRGHSNKIKQIEYVKNRKILISSSDDRSLKFWDVSLIEELEIKPIHSIDHRDSNLVSFDIFVGNLENKNDYVVCGFDHGDVLVYNFKTYNLVGQIKKKNNSHPVPETPSQNHIKSISLLKIVENKTLIICEPLIIELYQIEEVKSSKDNNENSTISLNLIISKKINYQKVSLNNQILDNEILLNRKIVSVLNNNFSKEIFLIDSEGESFLLNLKSFELISMHLDKFNTERTGALLWSDNILFIYCTNGCIYEYNLEKNKFTSKLKVDNYKISHCIKYSYLGKDFLFVHDLNQKMRIYS